MESQKIDKSAEKSTDSSWFSQPNTSVCDDSEMFVSKSRGRAGDKKWNFCYYCNKKQLKIARHLEVKHNNEKDVQEFLHLPKGSSERREKIGKIRKQGNFVFNTRKSFNDGELIVSRRPQNTKETSATHFKACSNCKAFFTKNGLRTHFKKCTGTDSTSHHSVMMLSKRTMGRLHAKASLSVKKYLFPFLREDNIVRLVRYDELIIIYANKMCEKYKNLRYFEMIRQRVRLLGRFLDSIKKINKEITDLA